MQTQVIKAFDLPSMWYRVLQACMKQGYERPVFRGSRNTQRRKELDYAVLEVEKPGMKPIVPDVPEGVPPPCDMAYVNRYLSYLVTPEKSPDEAYTYGQRMTAKIDPCMEHIDRIEGERLSSHSFSQLEKVVEFLKDTPETNRGIIEIGKAEDLLLPDPPCMRLLHWKVRYGALHLGLYFRSWDAWGGLPGNLAALQVLKEHLAGRIGVGDGKIFASSFGLHVYSGEWELAEKVLRGRR